MIHSLMLKMRTQADVVPVRRVNELNKDGDIIRKKATSHFCFVSVDYPDHDPNAKYEPSVYVGMILERVPNTPNLKVLFAYEGRQTEVDVFTPSKRGKKGGWLSRSWGCKLKVEGATASQIEDFVQKLSPQECEDFIEKYPHPGRL